MSERGRKSDLDNELSVFEPDGITLGEFQEIRQGDVFDPNSNGNGSEASSVIVTDQTAKQGQDVSWKANGNCREFPERDIFFSTSKRKVDVAKAICEMCPVRSNCLAYAVEKGERFGIWGGEEQKVVRRMIVARNKAKKAEAKKKN